MPLDGLLPPAYASLVDLTQAAAAVPDQLADEVTLVGPPARIRDRLAPWRESGVTTIICGLRQVEALRTVAEAGG